MKNIALISDGWRRLITYAWVDGIMNRARELNEDIILYQFNCYGNWSHDEQYNIGEYNIYNLPDFEVFDGIVLDCANIIDDVQRDKVISRLKDSGVPVVSVDYDVPDFYYVGGDDRRPIEELMDHLYHKHNCRSFVFAGGPREAFSNKQRVEAYRDTIQKLGLRPEDNPVLYGDFDFDTGVRYMQEYVEQKAILPDAFVCANDNIAAGLCSEADRCGYHVPEDFCVTGFDNMDKAAYFKPQITTAFQKRGRIGGKCLDVLLDLWSGKQVSHRTFAPVRCIYGESCGCPNSGRVDYREHIKRQIEYGVDKDKADALLLELEAEMARHSDFEKILDCVVEYFEKLSCDGVYIVVDKRLFEADAQTVFPTEGYDWENLVVAGGFENHERTSIRNVRELNRHMVSSGNNSTFLFTPIHFREQAVGYIMLKNGRFLFDSRHYYDIHTTIVRTLEIMFKQKQMEHMVQKLQDIYNRDPLTGIYNRIAYTDMICPAFAKYSRQGVVCALFFVDADDFKSINDNFGHEYGDRVLIRIAQVMQEECPKDGYVCRYGGDEFIIFFPHATPANTNAYMEKVKKRLSETNISISMGIKLTHSGTGETLDSYLSLADQNMYRQKQAHKAAQNENKNP